MAPVVWALRDIVGLEASILATAQHRELLDRSLSVFSLKADIDLDLMRPGQTLCQLTSRLFEAIEPTLTAEKPDLVLAQGDTSTVMAVAIACFYLGIPFGHVEAGLRTGNLRNPFPEEFNRVVAGRLAALHFAPTHRQVDYLLREGVAPGAIFETGNTVIDALYDVRNRNPEIGVALPAGKRMVLVTVHRRENFGAPVASIFRAIRRLVESNPDICVLYPVHPNPNVREPALTLLSGNDRIILCDPLDYVPFVAAMQRAHIILTDSGGVQEEGPALGKPVLVMREETERPEAVDAGVVKLVGTDEERLVGEVQALLSDDDVYGRMSKHASPYGDGHAAQRIAKIVDHFLHTGAPPGISDLSSGAMPELWQDRHIGTPAR